jgi:aspartate/methionine/tyrosine aminotransferase
MAGAKAVAAPLDKAAGFVIRRELIEPLITPRSRVIVLVNPLNPTGRVYSRQELQVLADLAIEAIWPSSPMRSMSRSSPTMRGTSASPLCRG